MRWCFLLSLILFQLKDTIKAQNAPVSIIFVGDIAFDACLKYYVDRGQFNYTDTMTNVANIIRKADIAVGNLESPFVNGTVCKKKIPGKALLLYADPLSAHALQFAGFDVMSLSNNHLNDFGDKPVNLTRDILRSVGIQSFGNNYNQYDTPQKPLIIKKRGIRVGFLGYCDVYPSVSYVRVSCLNVRKKHKAGAAIYTDRVAARDIKQLKRKGVDVILVYMHWGKEYTFRVRKREDRIAKYLHSLGAKAVIGSHPHTLQPHTYSKYHFTSYSLGNFLFPQHGTDMHVFRCRFTPTKEKVRQYEKKASTLRGPTMLSRILRIQLTRKGVVGAQYLPVEIKFDPTTKILQPTPINSKHWIDVCTPEDDNCLKHTI